jgi:hypothetical protein
MVGGRSREKVLSQIYKDLYIQSLLKIPDALVMKLHGSFVGGKVYSSLADPKGFFCKMCTFKTFGSL